MPTSKPSRAVVVCLGELLVDRVSISDGRVTDALGGAPANVASNLSRLGVEVALIACVGGDAEGARLIAQVRACGVDASHIQVLAHKRTTVAEISLDEQGEPSFLFRREADFQLEAESVSLADFPDCRILHAGSFSLSKEPFRQAQLKLLREAQRAGIVISVDLNIRRNVWRTDFEARQWCLSLSQVGSVIKVSDEELSFMTRDASLHAAAQDLRERSGGLLVVTLGRHGCVCVSQHGSCWVPGFSVVSENAVGCGDGFMAGLLRSVVENVDAVIGDNGPAQYHSLRFANAVGALVASDTSAVPPQLNTGRVEDLLRGTHEKLLAKIRTLVLFHLDGTVLRASPKFEDWAQEAIALVVGHTPTSQDHELLGKDVVSLIENWSLDEAIVRKTLSTIQDTYEDLALRESGGWAIALPGAREALRFLRDRSDVALGLVSEHSEAIARMKLARAGLEEFFAAGGYAAGKEDCAVLLGRAVERLKAFLGITVDEISVVVVGATVHDMRCAKRFGALAAGVDAGTASATSLEEAGADVIMNGIGDLAPLVSLL